MVKRANRQQTKHDLGVRKSAEYYQKNGFKVQADLEGFQKPRLINNRRPDLIARKGQKEVIVEVETRGSVLKDKKQQGIFESYATKRNNTRLRVKVV